LSFSIIILDRAKDIQTGEIVALKKVKMLKEMEVRI